MGGMRNAYRVSIGKQEADHLGDPGVDDGIVLERILKLGEIVWTGFI
jgi:hypothetical protein